MNIKKGDSIIVVSGKDKGKTGTVAEAFPSEQKVLIEGVNVKKVHERARREGQKGAVVNRAFPVHVSNVMIVDPKTKKRSRIGYVMEKNKKVRVAKKSGATL